MSQFQKQPPEEFYRKSCSEKFGNIHRKTPALESLFNTVLKETVLKETPTKMFFCDY